MAIKFKGSMEQSQGETQCKKGVVLDLITEYITILGMCFYLS